MTLLATLLLLSQAVAVESQGLHFVCDGIYKTTNDGATRSLPIVVECWIDVDGQRARADISLNGVHRESLVLTADSVFSCRFNGAKWTTVDARGSASTSGNWVFLIPFFMFTDRPTGNTVLPDTFFSRTPQRQAGFTVQRNHISEYVSRVEYRDDQSSLEVGVGAARSRNGLELKDVELSVQEDARAISASLVCRRVDMKLALPDAMFARPASREDRFSGLCELVKRRISLPASCSPQQLAESLRRVGKLNVTIDGSVSRNPLSIKSSSVAELLFVDLRDNWLDFRLAPEGIVIFSSRDSYKYRDTLEIRPSNEAGEAMRDMVLELSGHPEDWEEQGGEGSVIVRDDGIVEVNHYASTLLEIEYKLKELGKQ